VARAELDPKHDILPGINAPELIKSREPTAAEVREQIRVS